MAWELQQKLEEKEKKCNEIKYVFNPDKPLWSLREKWPKKPSSAGRKNPFPRKSSRIGRSASRSKTEM